VDQGVFSPWMARHLRDGTLNDDGWGGHGRQLRELLPLDDLADLSPPTCRTSPTTRA
jgi:CDP-paratose 2-epimerase